jgi:hypothetical protein
MKLILTLLVLFLQIPMTFGCKCNDPGTISEAYNVTPFVVYGKILSKEDVSLEETIKPSELEKVKKELRNAEMLQLKIIKVQVQVKESFKGKLLTNIITVYTLRGGASCGFNEFAEGKSFVIYAFPEFSYFMLSSSPTKHSYIGKDNIYWTSHCTRTTSNTTNEVAGLRKAKLAK